MQVDKGAIKHVMSGANIMAPGLTSPGGSMEEAEEGEVVAIFGEGKVHAMAIGKLLMSTSDMFQAKIKFSREINKGIAIEMLHHLGDALYDYKINK